MRRKGSRELRGTIKTSEVRMLQRALKAAKLENCAVDFAAQNKMNLYLQTWVSGPIEQVLKQLEARHVLKIAKEKGTL